MSNITNGVRRNVTVTLLVAIGIAGRCGHASQPDKSCARAGRRLDVGSAEPVRSKPPAARKPSRAPAGLTPAKLLVRLPDYCNTPDGMALLPDGNLLLSVPNFTDMSSPGILLKITPRNTVSLFCTPTVHPETGKVFPMGIAVGPSGDLYVADCQALVDSNRKSRLLKVVMNAGQPTQTITVAAGFNVANGVAIRAGYVYVTESLIDGQTTPVISGVFRFKLSDENVMLRPSGIDDPHLVAVIKTDNQVLKVGADGICFDSQGALYVGDCGDATVEKVVFDEEGNVRSNTTWAKAECIKSVDGLYCDQATDTIYVADILANAIHVISPDGTVRTLAQNGDTDGADGRMDAPCEAIVRGKEVIVSNFDRVFPGTVNTKPDPPCTLSVIRLD